MDITVSSANVADACLKLGIAYHCPLGLKAAVSARPIAGRALAVRHAGSVDIFLEAFSAARPGDILLVDNHGRTDEGCIGDLTALEAKGAGLQGIVIWGCHRDQSELEAIGLPLFSLGTCPSGPRRHGREAAIGEATVDGQRFVSGALVLADSDGVLIVPEPDERIWPEAEAIRATEERQAALMRGGVSLRDQLDFAAYLELRRSDPTYSLRDHLRRVGGAIET